MATNRYVGARYVPIFDGDWDNTKQYEPLTIVSYQGDSYTSRGYVPAGININNTTYWAKTGNFNQQVANLADLVTQCQADLGTAVADNIDDTEWTNLTLNDSQTAFEMATGCYLKYKQLGSLVILAINLDIDQGLNDTSVYLCDLPSAISPAQPAFFGMHVVRFSGGHMAIVDLGKSSPSDPVTKLRIRTESNITSGFFSAQIVYLVE